MADEWALIGHPTEISAQPSQPISHGWRFVISPPAVITTHAIHIHAGQIATVALHSDGSAWTQRITLLSAIFALRCVLV